MIALEKVTKTFDGKTAVRELDLKVPAGSVFGLIGPNGAGKTTTLRMISTLVKPDSGRIAVGDFDVSRDVRKARRILGYMPDQAGVLRGLSSEEYLQFFARAYGYRGAQLRERIEAVISLTDLGGLREESVSALSMGMRQRLSLAKTLLHDPQVLVLDEPASGLDPRARIEIRALLKELGRMGKTILISSHILADLEEVCTDVAILEEGKLVWSGSLEGARDELRKQSFEVALEVTEPEAERALKILEALPGVKRAARNERKIEVQMDGRHGNKVLEALIGSNVEILSFSEQRTDLESIFLERTRGIVS